MHISEIESIWSASVYLKPGRRMHVYEWLMNVVWGGGGGICICGN